MDSTTIENYICTDWQPPMKQLFKNLLKVCEDQDFYEVDKLADNVELLKAAARGSKRNDNEATNVRNWLMSNRLQFYDRVASALDILRKSAEQKDTKAATHTDENKHDQEDEEMRNKIQKDDKVILPSRKRKIEGDVDALTTLQLPMDLPLKGTAKEEGPSDGEEKEACQGNLQEARPPAEVCSGANRQGAKIEETYFDGKCHEGGSSEGSTLVIIQEEESILDTVVSFFNPDCKVPSDDFVQYKAIFNSHFTHSENKVELRDGVPREGIKAGQLFLSDVMVQSMSVTTPEGKTRQIEVKLINMQAISSLLNGLQYLVTEGHFATSIGFFMVQKSDGDEDEEEANLRMDLFSEICIPNSYISKCVGNAITGLLVKWLVDPHDLHHKDNIVVDCIDLDISQLLSKLNIRSAYSVTMCTGSDCKSRKTRLPFLTWPQFTEAAKLKSFPELPGECTMESCGKLAFQSTRTNGCSVFVLGPDKDENMTGFVLDAAKLHESRGYLDEVCIDSIQLRCQAAVLESYLGVVVVARGREFDSPWILLDPSHPETIHKADGVVGHVLAYIYMLK